MAQSLAERVRANERLELRNEVVMPAERELELDPALDAGLTELLEPLDLAPREVVVGEIGKRGAPPQRKRLTQRQERIGVLETAGVLEELFEAQGVEIAVVDPNEVAAGHGLDRCRAELFAQLRDEPLERLRSGLGRPPAPQLLDQAVARHSLVRMEEQEREQLPLVPAAEAQRGHSIVNLQRTENFESHCRPPRRPYRLARGLVRGRSLPLRGRLMTVSWVRGSIVRTWSRDGRLAEKEEDGVRYSENPDRCCGPGGRHDSRFGRSGGRERAGAAGAPDPQPGD